MKNTTRALAATAAALAAATLAAPAQADPRVGGDIGVRYEALGGQRGPLGQPLTGEVRTPDGRGAYVHFQGGSVYWSAATGAHEVHGDIRAAWAAKGWEAGFLGFPVTDEVRTPNGRGAYNHFQGGSVYWSAATGAHEVHGAIRDAWASYGWEAGALGFPTSDEREVPGVPGARRSDFQGGSVQWSARDGVTVTGDSGIAGCPSPYNRATPEQAADCLVRGWQVRRGDVMATYAVGAVVGELLATPWSPATAQGCERTARPVADTTAGIECVYHLPAQPGSPVQHGVDVHLGIGVYGAAAVVEDVELVG